MSSCQNIRDELSPAHGGTARTARATKALQSSYVQIDEKTMADWIVFARDYAKYLKYFNLSNLEEGDWTDFWQGNPAVILAVLAAAPVDEFRKASRQLFIELTQLEHQGDTPFLRQHFQLLFDLMTNLAWQLDQQIESLPDELAVKAKLRSRISRRLAPALGKWIGWYKAAEEVGPVHFPLIDTAENLIDPALVATPILGGQLMDTEAFYDGVDPSVSFSVHWSEDGQTDWSVYGPNIPADDTIYGNIPTLNNTAEGISAGLGHYFFTSVYEEFLRAFTLASQEASKALAAMLSDYPAHSPHFALFLAFLRLLTTEQAYLNTLTDRHLRFYYERVLRLQPKKFAPAEVHLLAELAKNTQAVELKAGTEFKAGKDNTGKNITFTLTEDFVANQAKVSEIRSLFKAPADPALYGFGDPERTIYRNVDRNRYFAATVANSADGMGADLTSDDGSWHPFANRIEGADYTFQVNAPRAEIGFAVASNYLYLNQGVRTIVLAIMGEEVTSLLNQKFRLSLTTEKGWYEIEATTQGFFEVPYLTIELPGDAPAILPYDPKVHGGNLTTAFPVLKAVLLQEDSAEYAFEAVKNTVIQGGLLFVDVAGKRDFSISGSTGPLDASKPFLPFGAQPADGSAMVIGDREAFQKRSNITLNIEWKHQDNYDSFFKPEATYAPPVVTGEKLSQLNWTASGNAAFLPDGSTDAQPTISLGDDDLLAPNYGPNLPFTAADTAGFARFKLYGDWGHQFYASALAKYAKEGGSVPLLPYEAQILDISLNYNAGQFFIMLEEFANPEETIQFFHLHPFGEAEISPATGGVRLFPDIIPQPELTDSDGDPIVQAGKDGGELLIGIEDMVVPGQLSLLVQAIEGSADPLLAKPDPHLTWYYLSGNDWQAFADGTVVDGTDGLLRTGLINFTLPADADTKHTLLPSGKIWLRAVAGSGVDAANQLIGIHAQGMKAVALDQANDPELWRSDLPAGTISKLVRPKASIKKIIQPYATFGGKAAENEADFFQRSSERLRHKDRAITRWDYERILLEAFPNLHKVKCLNHLRYEPLDVNPIYNELAPGHVTIIGVAKIDGNSQQDPLRPYVSLADLEAMHTHLTARKTCFAQLHVKNAAFEAIQTNFCVRFYPGYDETFYLRQLNQDLVEFLTPWAFDQEQEIEFGGKIYKGAIVNFIEERPYVDYIENLILSNTRDTAQQDVEFVTPSKRVSILVSTRQHIIKALGAELVGDQQEACGCDTLSPNQHLIQPPTALPT
ncbi:MAG: hypothetical protein AAF828_00810 [Bacteroidota bacterium]